MIAFCHACNMTALLGHRVSGWVLFFTHVDAMSLFNFGRELSST